MRRTPPRGTVDKAQDLPVGERRSVQRAEGLSYTIVNGGVIDGPPVGGQGRLRGVCRSRAGCCLDLRNGTRAGPVAQDTSDHVSHGPSDAESRREPGRWRIQW